MADEYVLLRSIAQWRNAPSNDLDILMTSKKHNDAFGLTGRLHKENGWYFHILEGEARVLREVVSRIQNDPRNSATEIMASGSCPARRFPDWDMGFSDGAHDQLEAIIGSFTGGKLSKETIAKVEDFLLAQVRTDTTSVARRAA
ncbi:MAG: BLUF domain-containing protein [Pseudomonadota bacterium]